MRVELCFTERIAETSLTCTTASRLKRARQSIRKVVRIDSLLRLDSLRNSSLKSLKAATRSSSLRSRSPTTWSARSFPGESQCWPSLSTPTLRCKYSIWLKNKRRDYLMSVRATSSHSSTSSKWGTAAWRSEISRTSWSLGWWLTASHTLPNPYPWGTWWGKTSKQ